MRILLIAVLGGLFLSHAFAGELAGEKGPVSDATDRPQVQDGNAGQPSPSPTPEPPRESETQKVIDQVTGIFKGAPERRALSNTLGLLSFSPMDLVIPYKKGATLGWIYSQSTTIELEYLSGSLSVPFIVQDLGEISDKRISLLIRSFGARNSFNFHYGVSYFDFTAHVGNRILSTVTGAGGEDLVGLTSLGFIVGIGNRWTFPHNITAGVDWFSWAQPIYTLRRDDAFKQFVPNQEDKDRIETALKIGSFFPRFQILKIQAGLAF